MTDVFEGQTAGVNTGGDGDIGDDIETCGPAERLAAIAADWFTIDHSLDVLDRNLLRLRATGHDLCRGNGGDY